MLCYIKDGRNFKTKYYGHATYDMTLKSIYDEVSEISLQGRAPIVNEGDFVILDGFFGIVKEIDRTEEPMSISCDDVLMLFSRKLFYPDVLPSGYAEDYLKEQIEKNFVNITDTFYRLPFLRVEALSQTAVTINPEREDDNFWNIKSYIRKLWRSALIYTEFSLNGDELRINIIRKDRPLRKIDLSLPRFEIMDESYSAESIARITAYAEDTKAYSDWYLLEDGGITQDALAAGRVYGSWEIMNVETEAEVQQEVYDTFQTNSFSHIVEFATNEKYGFYDEVVLRTKTGRLLKSYISAVRKQSGDSRIYYKTGELRTDLGTALNIKFNGG